MRIAGALVLIAVRAAQCQSTTVKDFPEFRVYAGVQGEHGEPLSGAKLCTTGTQRRCFSLARWVGHYKDDELTTDFGVRARTQRIRVRDGGSLILFNANSFGGSGSSDRYALLGMEENGRLRDLLPQVIVSNQADVVMWDLTTISPLPVLATADALWEDGAHYGPHFFEVRIYRYDVVNDRYALKLKYRTVHRYPGIDNQVEGPDVLGKERGRIMEKLGTQK